MFLIKKYIVKIFNRDILQANDIVFDHFQHVSHCVYVKKREQYNQQLTHYMEINYNSFFNYFNIYSNTKLSKIYNNSQKLLL